jgi:hypothetical protein
VSAKPIMQSMLSHAQSTQSLKIEDEVMLNNIGDRSTVINLDMKTKKLVACDGDTVSSRLSIPDESDTDVDTSREFDMVNEKLFTRSGTADTQESDKVKVYTMKFQNMKNHELSHKLSHPQIALSSRYKRNEDYFSTQKVSIDYRNNKPYRYKKTACIQKPFENTIGKASLLELGSIYSNLNRSAV